MAHNTPNLLTRVGTRVTRVIDGATGTVEQVTHYDGRPLFGVRLDKDGEIWQGTPTAWEMITTYTYLPRSKGYSADQGRTAHGDYSACGATARGAVGDCTRAPGHPDDLHRSACGDAWVDVPVVVPVTVGGFSNVKPAYFRTIFEGARVDSPAIAAATSVYDTTPAARGTRYFLASDGVAHWGYAIRPDGELVYVFSTTRGRGDAIVADAVRRGAVYLDCFDGHLATLYRRHGFQTVKTVPNWTPGKPDVVYMALEGFADRHGS